MPIEQHAPGLARIVKVNQDIEELASGFGGPTGPVMACLCSMRTVCPWVMLAP